MLLRVLSLLLALAVVQPLAAQERRILTGRVLDAHRGGPVVGARVLVEETGQAVTTGPQGEFQLRELPAGVYHLRVSAERFAEHRLERNDSSPPSIEVRLEPELHYEEVVSVSPNPRNAFESYQATSVLAGQDLSLKLEGSLGELLKTEPGVATRSLGPGPSRPVIRGLDGDRVLVLENGQRTDDLSSQSADHGVAVNPLAATRVEVVRGPATLLYGANAIGGLVNVVSDVIPTTPVERAAGAAQVELGTGAAEAGGAGDFSIGNGRFAFHAGGSARRSGDVSTPLGDVANSQSRSAIGHVGGSLTSSAGFTGFSYQYDDTRYGIPIVEGGALELTPRRHTFAARTQTRGLDGLVTAVRGSFGVRRYRHEEIEGSEVGTRFRNDTLDGELLATTRPIRGRLEGTYGVSVMRRSFEAIGEEALAPPIDQNSVAGFTYQEAAWPHVTVQFGGRVERTAFSPDGGLPSRDFTNLSGSAGVLFRPWDQATIAVSLARAVRNPALEELYFFGPHPGNFSFEIGNPDLDSEKALGIDVAFRWRLAHASGEVAYFRNRIDNFVFRRPTGEIEEDLPVIDFVGADSLLQGVEAHTDFEIAEHVHVELGVDYVRGELRDERLPLPRMPPFRFTTGARYQVNALQVGGQVVLTAEQNRVFPEETPTDGSGVLKLFGVYSLQAGRALHTFTARLDNVTNETYRNHLSYIKDLVPEMGRSVKMVYGVRF